MTKAEKVIKGLELLEKGRGTGYECGKHELYATPLIAGNGEPTENYYFDTVKLAEDALELLKAQQWVKFEKRELTEEEKAAHPEWCYIMENTPDDGEEILVSNGRYVWKDEFINNGDECYLDSDHDMDDCWWMPLPEPPKEGEDDES